MSIEEALDLERGDIVKLIKGLEEIYKKIKNTEDGDELPLLQKKALLTYMKLVEEGLTVHPRDAANFLSPAMDALKIAGMIAELKMKRDEMEKKHYIENKKIELLEKKLEIERKRTELAERRLELFERKEGVNIESDDALVLDRNTLLEELLGKINEKQQDSDSEENSAP